MNDNPDKASAQARKEKIVAEFEIPYRQYLDASGRLLGDAPAFANNREIVLPLYRATMLTRIFDNKAIALQRTGQLGTYPSCIGQEAVGVGYASVMTDKDVMLTTYREQAAQIWRGVTLAELLLYWGGDERGCDYKGPREDFPVAVPIATQVPHAVGVATAFKLRHEPRVAVCALGDGATSKGDFYEALNLAGVWQLPVVFVVINNHWAISMPVAKQTATKTLAQKAIAGGIPGIQIDGNDVIAVREVVGEAIARARNGGGPSLIEALTYRMRDHTTADDATRYRREEEVSAAWKTDPIVRLRTYIGANGWWSKEDEEQLVIECKDKVEAAVAEYLATPPPEPQSMFDHLFETLPASLEWQRKKLAGGGK
ncbi:MAG TPA: pyruvate dehydrogenase (acetyl-transferring) E1 component subunit alpha [Micropepsaceae bacterium]|nr:pyruvate dehydrogenase (acetyl-transferring) E1 component subunit alpha [Micropepsaceae bacterium]